MFNIFPGLQSNAPIPKTMQIYTNSQTLLILSLSKTTQQVQKVQSWFNSHAIEPVFETIQKHF